MSAACDSYSPHTLHKQDHVPPLSPPENNGRSPSLENLQHFAIIAYKDSKDPQMKELQKKKNQK